MSKQFKIFSKLLVLSLSLTIFGVGCSNTKDSLEDNLTKNERGLDVAQENDLTGDRNINKGTTREPDNNNFVDENVNDNDIDMNNDENIIDNTDMIERSKSLSNKVSELPEINSSSVVIAGDTALVGVNIAANTEKDKVTEIKNNVQNKVKELDRDIERVVVTADADLTTRIKNVGHDVESGKPISGFGGEIEEIIKRITPNM